MNKEFKLEPGKKYLMKVGFAEVDKVEGDIVYGWLNPLIRARWDLNGKALQIPLDSIHGDLICECVEPNPENPQQDLRWVEISERMPTEKDADDSGTIKVLSFEGDLFYPDVKLVLDGSFIVKAFLPLNSLPPYQKKEEELPDFHMWLIKQNEPEWIRAGDDPFEHKLWYAEKGREYERLYAAKAKDNV